LYVCYRYKHRLAAKTGMGIIKKQSILNTLVIYLGILIGFLSQLYIQPHFLKTEEIGLTRVLFSFSGILSVLMPIGSINILNRFFQKYKDDATGHNGFIGFILLYTLVGIGCFSAILYIFKDVVAASYAGGSQLFSDYFYLVFPFCFILTIIQVFTAYSFALLKSVIPSFFSEVVVRALFIICIFLYYFQVLSFQQFIYSFVLVYGANLLLLLGYVFAINKPSLKIQREYFTADSRKLLWRFGFVMVFASVSSLGMRLIDVVILAKYVDLNITGVYSIALFIGLFIETPLNSLERIAAPLMVKALTEKNHKDVHDIYHKSSTALFLIGGFLFLGVNACVVPLFWMMPPDYRGNELIVFIISLGALFNMASGSNTSIIYNSEHHTKGTVLLVSIFVLLVIMLETLVPRFGMVGAAMSIALSSFLYNLGKMLFIQRFYKMQPFGFDSVKLLLLITALYFVGSYLPHMHNAIIDILYRGSIVCIAYLVLAYTLKVIPEEFLKPVRKYLPI
jgi:O-antigen/teichoic acid export membrane protein